MKESYHSVIPFCVVQISRKKIICKQCTAAQLPPFSCTLSNIWPTCERKYSCIVSEKFIFFFSVFFHFPLAYRTVWRYLSLCSKFKLFMKYSMTLLNMFLTNKSLVYLMHNVYTKVKKYLSPFLATSKYEFKKSWMRIILETKQWYNTLIFLSHTFTIQQFDHIFSFTL